MKLIKYLFLIITISYLPGCNTNINQKKNPPEIVSNKNPRQDVFHSVDLISSKEKEPIKKTIELAHNFEIIAEKGETFGDFTTFLSLVLKHHSKTIYIDTSQTEYEFGDKLYPIVDLIDTSTFEVLIEVNDRPNKNYLKYLKIRSDSIIENKDLPTFIAKASNLDNDNNLEYAGIWDYSQIWGTNEDTIAYNPIIYYEITKDGLVLDSALTITENTLIYGEFKGFHFSEQKAVSYKMTNSKLKKEFKRIESN